jgi:3-deoxy-manno-octulosonate cytidylyltransferase (CMP-KDO synthetase)
VLDDHHNALYFSRSPIPFPRDRTVSALLANDQISPWLLHVGLYAYRREFLLRMTSAPPSSLELLEKLEQLRALQSGATIAVAVIDHAAVGIDTAEDYAAFVRRQKA